MKDLLPALLGSAVRALLQLAAGAGLVVAPGLEGQLTAVAIGLATLAWSFWQKHKAAK